MRIGVVGAGALGSVLGGLLFEAGLDVVLIERDPEEVRFVKENGLWLEGVTGERLLRPRIVCQPLDGVSVDLVLVLVKSYRYPRCSGCGETNTRSGRCGTDASKWYRQF